METWFFRNPRGFALAVLVILAMGWSALLTIGRQEDPTITNLFANVFTPYPGADPARVEALVTEKIEAELRGIGAIAEIRSVSRTGLSVVSIELGDTLGAVEIEQAWTDVRNALDDAAAELPAGVARRASRTTPRGPSPRSWRWCRGRATRRRRCCWRAWPRRCRTGCG
jgi:multidrug efflux pump subunit AcrB